MKKKKKKNVEAMISNLLSTTPLTPDEILAELFSSKETAQKKLSQVVPITHVHDSMKKLVY